MSVDHKQVMLCKGAVRPCIIQVLMAWRLCTPFFSFPFSWQLNTYDYGNP
jgi:hypothetical protein